MLILLGNHRAADLGFTFSSYLTYLINQDLRAHGVSSKQIKDIDSEASCSQIKDISKYIK